MECITLEFPAGLADLKNSNH